ncbi:MAG: globin domain-containing protein [Oligoflexales bacterium]
MRIQATIITQSFKHIVASGSQVVDHAYDLMRKMYPDFATFVTEFGYDQFKVQLLNSLIFLVDHLDEGQTAIEYLQSIGKRLRNQNIKPEYFDELKDVLIRSIATFLNEKWTPKAREQWGLAFEFFNYHLMQSANIAMNREFELPSFQGNSKNSNIEKSIKSQNTAKPESFVDISLENKAPSPSPSPSSSTKPYMELKQKVKGMSQVDDEFADIFAQLEPELEALVSLSPQQLEQIKQGATSYAKALVAKYWEESFKGALEEELTDIEDGDGSSKSNSEAA